MLSYNFRLSFNLRLGDRFISSASEMKLFKLRGGQIIRLSSGGRSTPIQDHSRASLVGGPFNSEDEARTAAEHTRQALLIWALRKRIGVDPGDRKIRSYLSDAGKDYFGQQPGKPVRNDLQGIDIYPDEGDVVFLRIEAKASLAVDAQSFATDIRDISERTWNLSDKQKVAGELYCASFFDEVFRSRFITLVTAVEALLDAQQRDCAVQTFVDQAKMSVQKLDIEAATKEALTSGLERLRQNSIGQTGREMSDQLLAGHLYGGLTPGKFFNMCYRIRNDTVHRGAPKDGEVDFLDLANNCQKFVGDLLMASYEASAALPTLAADGQMPFP
ncbi:MAG: hypothetical protein ACLP5H_21665 [Desulfomonilaceae bacterium]